jgi:hypothetical protein
MFILYYFNEGRPIIGKQVKNYPSFKLQLLSFFLIRCKWLFGFFPYFFILLLITRCEGKCSQLNALANFYWFLLIFQTASITSLNCKVFSASLNFLLRAYALTFSTNDE